MDSTQKSNKAKAVKIIIAVLGVIIILSVVGYILIKRIFGGNGENNQLKEMAESSPFSAFIAAILVFAACIVQVVIAFIPGELLEQFSGYMFGTWFGLIICVAGNLVGSVIVILLVRKFGRKLVYAFYPQEKIENNSFLREGKRRNITTFFLFFIPGTPKDLLTYIVGLTDMSIPLYLALTTFARVPSVLMSTVSGKWISDAFNDVSKIWLIVIWNLSAIAICGIGYLIYMLIERRRKTKNSNITDNKEK